MGNEKKIKGNREDTLHYVSGENLEKILELTFNELFYFCESKEFKMPDSKPFWLLNTYYKFVRIIDNNSNKINKNQILINLTKELYVNGYIFFGAKCIKKAFQESNNTNHTKVA